MDYPYTICCRLAEDDLARLDARADALGLGRSELLRILIRLPEGSGAAYVIDTKTLARMATELARWGNHYNQAVHALNTLALFVRRGHPPDAETFERLLTQALEELDTIEGGRGVVELVLADIARASVVRR